MANDHELKYKITTSGDASGAEAVAKGIDKVNDAAGKTAKSAGDAAKNLNQTGEVAEKLRGGATAVQEVLSGNLRALSQFPAILKAIAASVSANPLFALGTVLGLVIIPALQKMKDGWAAAGKAAEEAGKKSDAALASARTAVTEKRNNVVAQQFEEIARQAANAAEQIRRATDAQIEQIDAVEAEELALIEADPKLTPAQKTLRRLESRGLARDRRTRDALQAVDVVETGAFQAEDRSRDELGFAIRNEEAARRVLENIRSRSPDVIRRELGAARAGRTEAREAELQAARAGNREGVDAAGVAIEKFTAQIELLTGELARAANYAETEKSADQDLSSATATRKMAEDKVREAIVARDAAERAAAFERTKILTAAARDRRVSAIERDTTLTQAGVGKGAEVPSFIQPGVQRAADRGLREFIGSPFDKVAAAAESVKAPDTSAADASAKRAADGIIKIGETVYKVVNGQAQRLETVERAVEQVKAQMANLRDSSQ